MIYTSSITAWEVALLVDRGLIDLDIPVDAWVQRFLRRHGIEAVRLSHHAPRSANSLSCFIEELLRIAVCYN